MRRILFSITLSILTAPLLAQFGGGSTYDFLNISSSARVNALGGTQVGMADDSELSLSYYNPATLRKEMHQDISLNYIDYINDIKIGYASYAWHSENIGTFATGIQYFNYGTFIQTDESGNKLGFFSAKDYALNLIYSKNVWNKLHVGAAVKPLYSIYEVYTSLGIAADLGLSIADSSGLFNAGIVLKNFGTQLTTYNENGFKEPLPLDLQAGFSQRLEHAPFRFNVTIHQLLNWKLSDKTTWDFDNSNDNDFVVGRSDDFIKQFARHLILGVEFIPSENFLIGIGYNFQRRFELGLKNNPAAAGLSGGFTVNVSKFRVSYAITSYHISSVSNIFSVTTNLSEFIR